MTSLKHLQEEPQEPSLMLYRMLISTPFGKRWVSKWAISEEMARMMVANKNNYVVKVEVA